MSKIMNYMMDLAEAGLFQFRDPPDYPDEAEYYGCGITWGQARDMLDNLPSQPEWTDEQLNDYERQCAEREQKKNFIPVSILHSSNNYWNFELDEVPF